MKDGSCKKNASCRQYGGFKVGKKLGSTICNGGPQAPHHFTMTPHWLGNWLYFFPPFTETLWFPCVESRMPCPIDNEFCQSSM